MEQQFGPQSGFRAVNTGIFASSPRRPGSPDAPKAPKAPGPATSTLNRLIRSGYNLLDLISFFTVGLKEAHAWTAASGVKAPQAAGKIHTDFEKGFIRAETISYLDYINYNGENGAKDAGKMRVEGSDYLVKDGDIFNFRFNV